ncbi:hypothetical protein SCP_0115340 [Sparassis crispa]|uniref:Arsenite methyltransferase n=1 Tax=Sparassis crispa TaxID=139825 RepID=A0A401G903_9APHY|nr:hypothetical protein SCP_0115340 [Sparassis crispa]GBE78645.1 hypothetical protein SCP_0115340 [Sparassis crispa]
MSNSEETLVEAVRDAYSAKAKASVDKSYVHNVASAFGYSVEELQALPAGANLGLSCGNPIASASLKEGETVLDLGSGGGIDIFLAASKIGPTGKAIGLDMSEDMVALARRNASKQGLKPPHVAFVQALLTEPLPIAANSIDCIISNCVINLLPGSGKAKIMQEAFRVLKPGGRIALSDILAKKPLPENIRNDLAAYIGCISGAIVLDEYRGIILDAGFSDPMFVDKKADLNVYFEPGSTAGFSCCATPSSCCGPQEPNAPNFDSNEWAGSYQIYAVKPPGEGQTESPEPLLDWWLPFPATKSDVPYITADELASMMKGSERKDYAVIDVRQTFSGGRVRGSLHCPPQNFFDELPAFVEKFGQTKQVIFYCGLSSGKAPRCSRWYQDRLNDSGIKTSAAYILKGGIKGWLANYDGQEELVDRV